MFVKLWHKNSHRWPIASRLWPHRPKTGMESHRGQNGSHSLGFKLCRTAQFCARFRKRNGLKTIRRQGSVCSTSFVTWPLQKVFLRNEIKPHVSSKTTENVSPVITCKFVSMRGGRRLWVSTSNMQYIKRWSAPLNLSGSVGAAHRL